MTITEQTIVTLGLGLLTLLGNIAVLYFQYVTRRDVKENTESTKSTQLMTAVNTLNTTSGVNPSKRAENAAVNEAIKAINGQG